jgi:hypothetical protein
VSLLSGLGLDIQELKDSLEKLWSSIKISFVNINDSAEYKRRNISNENSKGNMGKCSAKLRQNSLYTFLKSIDGKKDYKIKNAQTWS